MQIFRKLKVLLISKKCYGSNDIRPIIIVFILHALFFPLRINF